MNYIVEGTAEGWRVKERGWGEGESAAHRVMIKCFRWGGKMAGERNYSRGIICSVNEHVMLIDVR